MDSQAASKGAGFFLTILGALTLGISVGVGIASAAVKSRLTCVPVGDGANACQDILSATGDMTVAAGIGGFIAFFAGIAALALLQREETDV